MKRVMRMSVAGVLAVAGVASAQHASYLVADRTTNVIWRLTDLNDDGVITTPEEAVVFFGEGNAPGTLAPDNPTMMEWDSATGVVLMGDQARRCLYLLRDLNGDGDAMDIGESVVAADASNASGESFAFPTGGGIAEDGNSWLVVNAGNGFGDDRLYRCVDVDGDGRFQSAGEVIEVIAEPTFVGNGPYSPQEIVVRTGTGFGTAGFLRNSSANLHGVYAYTDTSGDGVIGAGEFVPYWTLGASGVTPLAGFAIAAGLGEREMYALQLATGGVDQLVRLVDVDGNGSCNDAGEATVVWSTGESGFTSIDVIVLADGDVLITDNSGGDIVRLHDADGNGLFDNATERTAFLVEGADLVVDARQLLRFSDWFCHADRDHSGAVDSDDIIAFFGAWDSGEVGGDYDGDGDNDSDDIVLFFVDWDTGC